MSLLASAWAGAGEPSAGGIEPIPGDPGGLQAAAAGLRAAAGALEDSRARLAGIASGLSGPTWSGEGAASFAKRAEAFGGMHSTASCTLAQGAAALNSFASLLEACQAQVRTAQRQAAEAEAWASQAIASLSSSALPAHDPAAAAQRASAFTTGSRSFTSLVERPSPIICVMPEAPRLGTEVLIFPADVGPRVIVNAAKANDDEDDDNDLRIPRGFRDPNEFEKFSEKLTEGLKKPGYKDTKAFFQGSSVTGIRFGTDEEFDEDSDYDIALCGRDIFDKAKDLGIPLRGGGTRAQPLKPKDLNQLGLAKLQMDLSGFAGRAVKFMIFRSTDDALARGASIPVPGS